MNGNQPINPQNMLFPQGPQGTPKRLVEAVVNGIKSMVILIFWGVLGAFSLAVGYVALRAIWWFVCLACESLGV